jgi:deoxyribodipyrimidine photo-lyase
LAGLHNLSEKGVTELPDDLLLERVRKLRDRPYKGGKVVYWMDRDQRISDNWALDRAISLANERNVELCIAYCLPPKFLGGTLRQFGFMIKGLQELEAKARSFGFGFHLLEGYPEIRFPSFLHSIGAGMVITDFDPLRSKREWKRRLAGEIDIPFEEVDAHNIVPCWVISKRRISNYVTFRARINPFLETFLTDYPPIKNIDRPWSGDDGQVDWKMALGHLKIDRTIEEVKRLEPGEVAAQLVLTNFIRDRLSSYHQKIKDPVSRGQSELSPYLHFGQISSQSVALKVRRSDAPEPAKEKYLDQLIIKKELSDNFCLRTPEYDTVGAFPEWARKSLNDHRSDPREHVYTLEQFENGQTHDPLWNAAQMEMVKSGTIHGALRAYWADKILEWTSSPEEAFEIALYLNDRYELDGGDPNGYTGIAMVIGGLYGRPWRSKDILGKVRSLTYTEMRLGYDIKAYEKMVRDL